MEIEEVSQVGKLAQRLEIGRRDSLTTQDVADIIENMYAELADAINRKPDIIERETDGQADDVLLSNGSFNINSSTGKVEILTEHTSSSAVTWVQLS